MPDYENMSIAEVQRLAKQGDKDALFEMRFRRTNDEEASVAAWDAFWLSRAAGRGHRIAMYLYADLLREMPFPAKDCEKALEWYDKFETESKKLGKDYAVAYAKIESGIILCEGLGLGKKRNHKRGVELIDEGLAIMAKINEKPNASQLFRLSEMYAQGYARENEVQSADDLKKAIECLEKINDGDYEHDGPGLYPAESEKVDKYLSLWKPWLPDKIKLEQEKKTFTEDTIKLGCQEVKHIYDEEVQEIHTTRTTNRRYEDEQPTEAGRRIENFIRRLQERFE